MNLADLFLWLPPAGLGRVLADLAWQSTVLGMFAAVACYFFSPRPALRAAWFRAALAFCLLGPALAAAGRSLGWGLLASANTPRSSQNLHSHSQLPLAQHAPATPHSDSVSTDSVSTASQGVQSFTHARTPAFSTPAPTATVRNSTPYATSLWRWITAAWVALSLAMAARLIGKYWRLRYLIRRATPDQNTALANQVRELARQFGLRRPPQVLFSDAIGTPGVVGLWRPRLLWPAHSAASAADGPAVRHELAHLVRGDLWGMTLGEWALVVLPWQPLVWWLDRAHRQACEQACDDWTVAMGVTPLDLAEALTAWVANRMPATALGMADSADAARARIVRLLSMQAPQTPRVGTRGKFALGALASCLVATTGLAQPGGEPDPTATDPAVAESPDNPTSRVPTASGDSDAAYLNLLPPQGTSQTVASTEGAVAPPASNNDEQAPPGDYRIGLGDTLLLNFGRLVAGPSLPIRPGDILKITASDALPDQPIRGEYFVDGDGTVVLGPAYGHAKVGGLLREDAERALVRHLELILRAPSVLIEVQPDPALQLDGPRLVLPDGRISMGRFEPTLVAGLTLTEACAHIEAHLASKGYVTEVGIDLDLNRRDLGYCLVVFESLAYEIDASNGKQRLVKTQQFARLPLSGHERLLDAVAICPGKVSWVGVWAYLLRQDAQDPTRTRCRKVNARTLIDNPSDRANELLQSGDRLLITPTSRPTDE